MAISRAVVFDLFETLVTESNANPIRAGTLGPRLGLDAAAFRREWRIRRPRITLGRQIFVDALHEIGVALGLPPPRAELERIRQERLLEKSATLREVDAKIVELLDEFLRRGTRLAVISNCFPEDVASWTESPLGGRIRAAVFSFEVGLAKPDPAIYAEALHRLGVSPEMAVFIGDGADDELVGAAGAGLAPFRAGWFVSSVAADAGFRTLRQPEDVLTVA